MDKCKREKEKIYDWAGGTDNIEHSEKFTKIDNSMESYFIPRDVSEYLVGYNFETMPELKRALEKLWQNKPYMQNIIQVVLVSAMKNKPVKINEEKEQIKAPLDHEEKLPVFIYNF